MNQINITKIQNGWLVGNPGQGPSAANPQGTPPVLVYCIDYDAVCAAIRPMFPATAPDSNVTPLSTAN